MTPHRGRLQYNIQVGRHWPVPLTARGVLLIVSAFSRRERRA